MARNDANEDSDLDLLVELEDGKSGFAMGGFLEDVTNLLHRKVVIANNLHECFALMGRFELPLFGIWLDRFEL